VNHELRKKDKESSISTSAEVLAARELVSIIRRARQILVKLVIVNWERISVLSTKRKDTGILIV